VFAVKILLKGFLCGLIYLAFTILIVIVGCTSFDVITLSYVLGAVYGVIAALTVCCEKALKTFLSCVTGLFFIVVADFINWLNREQIALYMYRNNDFVRDMGRLSVQHRIGYNWGLMVFKPCALAVFIIAVFAASFIKAKIAKNKKEKKVETLS